MVKEGEVRSESVFKGWHSVVCSSTIIDRFNGGGVGRGAWENEKEISRQ